MPRRLGRNWYTALALCVVVASVSGCDGVIFKRTGRACEPDVCPEGFVCHPEQGFCAPEIQVGCTGDGALCPTTVNTGDDCPSEGSFVPCAAGATGCALGCRTCQPDLSWSDCTAACELGRVQTCAACDDNCEQRVLNASALCVTTGDQRLCDYQGECQEGFFDIDDSRENGCECHKSLEVCDNVDNNCDGLVDEDLPACQCADGGPASEICDGIDNDCNQAVDDGFECAGTDSRECDIGIGEGSGMEACDDVTCTWSAVCRPHDTVPPTGVTDLGATAGDTEVTLSWTYPSDSDLAYCVLRRSTTATPADQVGGFLVAESVSPSPGTADVHYDGGLLNATSYYYAVFCRDTSGNWQEAVDAGNSVAAAPAAVVPDLVADLAVTSTGDGGASLLFTMPQPRVDSCALRRTQGAYPTDHNDGVAVGTYTGAGMVHTIDDGSLTNGTDYRYAVFCLNDIAWNDTVQPGSNARAATPMDPTPANPTNLVASDGDDGSVAINFDIPAAPLSECLLLRKEGGYPSGHGDAAATQIRPPFTTAESSQTETDGAVVNGTAYYYAVFCRNGTTWNDALVVTANADTGEPQLAGTPENPSGLTVTDGDYIAATIAFVTPATMNSCVLLRKEGSYPTDNGDSAATTVGTYSSASSSESVTDTPLTNGTTYYYAVFCEIASAWNDTVVIGSNAGTATPLDLAPANPLNVSASDGANAESVITFTSPSAPIDECILLRKQGDYPSDHGDSAATQVGSSFSSPGGDRSATDSSLINGTVYYYAVFCRNGTTWNDTVAATTAENSASLPGFNADVATPLGSGAPLNPNNLAASDGDDGTTTVTFTTPGAGFDSCVLLRKDGAYPVRHDDAGATQVGSPFVTGASDENEVDTGLVNGSTYYYAVFCGSGGQWNDNVVENDNADMAVPLDTAPDNPTDLVATSGEDSRVTVTLTTPVAPMDMCVVMRKEGADPVAHDDADATRVGGPYLDPVTVETINDSVGLNNGTTYHYAAYCRNGTTWNETATLFDNLATGLPIDRVGDFDASDRADQESVLTYTAPVGTVACKIMRTTGTYPAESSDGTLVLGAEQAGPGPQSVTDDLPLINGTEYFYAVFCRVDTVYRNDTVDPGAPGKNADAAIPLDPPPANPINVAAVDGESSQVTVDYTTPAEPMDECALLRRQGGYPTDHVDSAATVVGTSIVAETPVTEVDDELADNITYYYAVFCRNGTTWNDVVDSIDPEVNAATGTPGGAPPNPVDMAALDGEFGQVRVSFTTPPDPMTGCTVYRKTGDYPTDHADAGATPVAGPYTTAETLESFTDTSGVSNGVTYYYAVFCENGGQWNDSSGTNADTGTPLDPVLDFDASDGEDGRTTLTYTSPVGATACKIMRQSGDYPADSTDGTLVGGGEQAGGGAAQSVPETGLSNGTDYYYAAFCHVDGTYRNNTVDSSTPDLNADTARPIGLVTDLATVDGLSTTTTITYTMPTGAAACKVMRQTGGYSANNADGTLVDGSEQTGSGSQSVPDSALADGTTYYYAAFCRSGTSYNNDTVDAIAPDINASTAQPIGVVTDFDAVDGLDGQTTLAYTIPSGAAACKILRQSGAYPTGSTDGTIVGGMEQTGPGLQSVPDASVSNGVTYYYAAFCRSGPTYTNNAVDSAGGTRSADTARPIAVVADFSATDGDFGQSVLTYAMPTGAVACKIQRQTGGYPASNTDGTQVGAAEQSGGGSQSVTDGSLAAGTTYSYAVFCRSSPTYTNDTVDSSGPTRSADTGTPIGLVTDFAARDGEDGTTTLTYTMPAGALACKILRKPSAYPTSNTDGTQLGAAEQFGVGAQSVGDSGLSNGTTYYYAVFCRGDTVYRNDTVDSTPATVNADTALPIAVVTDLVAIDGQDSSTTLGYTMPAGAQACKLIRNNTAYPTSNTDGAQVGGAASEQTSGGAQSVPEGSLTNGAVYYYAVFCRSGATYVNDTVTTPNANADTGTPIGIVADFTASSGDDSQSALDFTKPTGASWCKIMRQTGGYPTDNTDGTQVGSELATNGPVTDNGVTNGITYYYAIFCRADSVYRNDTVTASQNAATALPSACTGQSATLTLQPAVCVNAAPADTSVLVMHLSLTSTCNNALDALTISSHASSSTGDGEIKNVALYEDNLPLGLGGEDGSPVQSAVSLVGGQLSFSGFLLNLAAGSPKRLLVIAEVTAGVGQSLFVPEVSAVADFSVTDNGGSRLLSATPLVGPVTTIADPGCTGVPPEPTDFGPGTLMPADITTLQGTNSSWGFGAGDETGWRPTGGDGGATPQRADCNLESVGTSPGPMDVSDHGKQSHVLHIDTGIPLNAPICSGPTLRVYGTNYNPSGGACDRNLLTNYAWLRVYVYDDATTVDTASGQDYLVNPSVGPTTASTCASHYMDIDLSGRFAYAVANPITITTANLEVRLIFEDTSLANGLNGDSGPDLTGFVVTVPEAYVYMP